MTKKLVVDKQDKKNHATVMLKKKLQDKMHANKKKMIVGATIIARFLSVAPTVVAPVNKNWG